MKNYTGFLVFFCLLIIPELRGMDGSASVVVGTVTMTPPGGGAAKPLKAGDAIPVGSTVKTGPASRAVIKTTRQSAIRLAENSEIVMNEMVDSETTPKVLLDLKSGSMGALIQPQAQSAMDFKVKTPSGVAAARGTLFAVAVEDGKGFVKVEHGKVEVTPANVQKQIPEVGKATVVVGTVTETPPGGQAERPLKSGDIVQVGSTIKTGADSRATITMTTTSSVRIGPGSETVIKEIVESKDAPKVLIDLKSGTMGALVKPEMKGKMDFKIQTPSGVAAARGTFFSVAVENGRGYVQTKEGEVVIIPPDKAAGTAVGEPKAK